MHTCSKHGIEVDALECCGLCTQPVKRPSDIAVPAWWEHVVHFNGSLRCVQHDECFPYDCACRGCIRESFGEDELERLIREHPQTAPSAYNANASFRRTEPRQANIVGGNK